MPRMCRSGHLRPFVKTATFAVQETVPNFRKSANIPIAAAPDGEWQKFDFAFVSRYRLETMLAFHLGYHPQTVELGEL